MGKGPSEIEELSAFSCVGFKMKGLIVTCSLTIRINLKCILITIIVGMSHG